MSNQYLTRLVFRETRVGGKTQQWTVFTYFKLALPLLVLVLGIVGVREWAGAVGEDVIQKRGTAERLLNRNRQLEVEYMRQAALQKVDERALKMGLQLPSKDRVVQLGPVAPPPSLWQRVKTWCFGPAREER